MRQKVKKLMLYLLFLTLISVSAITVMAVGIKDTTPKQGALVIPFEKIWANGAPKVPVTIKLYKYIGDTFDTATEKIQVGTITLDGMTDDYEVEPWKYNFDISNEDLMSGSKQFYKFKVVEEVPNGYREIVHKDPNVIFNEPNIPDDEQHRYETCKDTQIPFEKINDTPDVQNQRFIAGKLTGSLHSNYDFAVWSEEELSEGEKKIIANYIGTINGFSPKPYYNSTTSTNIDFFFENQEAYGMSVDDKNVNFKDPSNWSLLGLGYYKRSTVETISASITNDIDKTISVEKIWDDFDNKYGFRPDSITVVLKANGVIKEEVTLNEANKWKYTWNDLPRLDDDGKEIVYTIEEKEKVPNYIGSEPVYNEKDKIWEITNKLITKQFKIIKKWENTDVFGEHLPTIVVELKYCKKTLENKECTLDTSEWLSETIEISKDNSWTYTWDAPEGFVFKIEEIGFKGIDGISDEDAKYLFDNMFEITYGSETDNNYNFTITNTYKGPKLPETGSMGGLIKIVISTLLLGISTIYLVYSFTKKSV